MRIKYKTLYMNRLTKIAVLCSTLFASLWIVACDGPRAIPDKDLVKIFHDAFLANAYISECNIAEDSLLLYEPILARYGYTVEDMRHTVSTIASRKSSRLSDLVGDASALLEEESKGYNYQLRVLDTVDNVAKRRYTRVMHTDSLIRVRRLSDSTTLQITLKDLVPGEYTVEIEYYIDTTDENRNSRVEAYLKLNDGTQALRHTMMLSRYRDGKYSRKFVADTSHKELFVNVFFHPASEEPKKPDVKIKNLKITRVIPVDKAVDSLYDEQLGALIFNQWMWTSFAENKTKPEPRKSTHPEVDFSSITLADQQAEEQSANGTEPNGGQKPASQPSEVRPTAPGNTPNVKREGEAEGGAKPGAPNAKPGAPNAKPGAPGARPTPQVAKPQNGGAASGKAITPNGNGKPSVGKPNGKPGANGKPNTNGNSGERPKKFDPTKNNPPMSGKR